MRAVILLFLLLFSQAAWAQDNNSDKNQPSPAWEQNTAAVNPASGQNTAAVNPVPETPPVTMVLKDSDPPITITAQQMRYDQKTGRLEFFGQVRLHRGDELIEGDQAIWHDPSGSAEISGNVRLLTPDFSAVAQRATVNMDLRLAKIYDGRAFFPQRHFYVQGALLERRGVDQLYVQEGKFTTCEGEETSWNLEAKNLLVNQGGMATASGVVFNTRYMPLLYLPYFTVPIKNERQTGFLIPGVAHSSRDGMTVSLPFFWAINEDYDLTFTPVWRSKRGLAMTLEGRYNLEAGQGIWLVTYLNDHKNNYFNYNSFGQPRKGVKDVYWIRGQNNWQAGDWNLSLDVDLVSDPLSLYAFRNDIDGFRYTQRLFGNYFGRTVNEELDPLRLSTFFAQRKTDDTLFRGTLTYVNNLYSKNNVDTIQNLPDLYFGLVSRPLTVPGTDHTEMDRPRLNLDLRYDYFTRSSDSHSPITETGHRFFASPSLFWHHDFFGIAGLKAQGGFSFSAYSPNGRRPMGPRGIEEHSQSENTISGEFSVELSTTLSRIYQGGFGEAEATLHQITPFMAFEFVEAPSQEDLPYWDMYDRKLRRRTLRYGFRNTLLTKSAITDPQGQLTGYDYRPLLRLGIYSSYEFANNLEWAEKTWARYFTQGYFDRGVGPYEFELETNFNPYISMRLLSSIDGRTGQFTRHDLSLTVNDLRGDYLSLMYDYESPTLEQGPSRGQHTNQVRGDIHFEISGGWSATVSSRFDFQSNKGLETYVNLHYSDQCYGLALVYADSDDDRRIALVVDLLGLGSFGTPGTSLSSREDN
jgi:LPS-assembly protein